MKKLIILTLLSLAIAGFGNVITRGFSIKPKPNAFQGSGWAMFKELFQ